MFKSCPRNHMKNGRTSGFTVLFFFRGNKSIFYSVFIQPVFA